MSPSGGRYGGLCCLFPAGDEDGRKADDWCYLEAVTSRDGLALLGPGYKAAGPHFAFHFRDRAEVDAIHDQLKSSGVARRRGARSSRRHGLFLSAATLRATGWKCSMSLPVAFLQPTWRFTPIAVTAHQETLELLEWPRVCEHLPAFASTVHGSSHCQD